MNIPILKRDNRPAMGLYAPGNYINTCSKCNAGFVGDKRAVHCADCAYKKQTTSIKKYIKKGKL